MAAEFWWLGCVNYPELLPDYLYALFIRLLTASSIYEDAALKYLAFLDPEI